MKRYCITMERTQRVAVWFDAPNDEAAERKAERINDLAKPSDFETGDEERDFALEDVSEGRTIIDWSN